MVEPQDRTAIALPRYIPQLDGLRGIAILAVFAAHSEFVRALPHAAMLEYGRVGVDLFFVLSGFLITGILVDSKDSPHYFRNFYMRRALRIWPLYYAVLAGTFIILPALFASMNEGTSHLWPYFVFYTQNLFPHLNGPRGLDPTWSLALEEQFYIIWPPLVFFLERRTLQRILFSAVGFSLALRIIGYALNAPLEFIHNFTLSRLDAIALGSLAALWLRSPSCTPKLWRVRSVQAMLFGLIGTAVLRVVWPYQSTVIGYTTFAIGFAGVVGISLVLDTQKSFSGRLLTSHWLRYTGKISYGLYLLHMSIFLWWERFVYERNLPLKGSALGNASFAAIQFALAFLVASLSWRFFEQPILRLKRYFPSGSALQNPSSDVTPNEIAVLPDQVTE